MKKAELRSTYLKQLGELCQLRDNRILTEEQYEEQREDLNDSMRCNLKEQGQYNVYHYFCKIALNLHVVSMHLEHFQSITRDGS